MVMSARVAKRPKTSAKPRTSFCPACDARLTTALADDGSPHCPRCDETLLPVKVAGMWRRAVAATIDLLVLVATAGVLNWGLLSLLDPAPLLGEARGLDAVLRLMEISPSLVLERIAPALIMTGLYFGLFWATTGRTPGQRLLRLRVVGARGAPPSPLRAAMRVVGKLLAIAPGGLGLIWVAFDREKRGWHDHLAGTYVITES